MSEFFSNLCSLACHSCCFRVRKSEIYIHMGTPDTNDMSWEYTHAPVLYTASNPDKRAFAEVLRDHPKPVSTYSGILPGQRQYANGNVPPWHKRFGVVVLNTILYTVQYTKGRLASVGLRHSRHSSYRQDTAISRQLERQATSTSITPPMFVGFGLSGSWQGGQIVSTP